MRKRVALVWRRLPSSDAACPWSGCKSPKTSGILIFEKKTPLHYAAEASHVTIIKILASHGVDINTRNSKGRKAIYYATKRDFAAAVEALIALGADPSKRDKDRRTIFHCAAHMKVKESCNC